MLKEVGVDWITVTCNEPELRTPFREMGIAMLHVEGWDHNDVKPWSFMGFEGLHSGGAAFGEMDQMSIMRLSGGAAHSHWKRAYELSTNCSRLDVQVTYSQITNVDKYIVGQYQSALDHHRSWTKPPTLDLRLSNRTGHTAYFNTRGSNFFGRTYSKWHESKLDHYRGCVRFEVQCNGRAAKFNAASLSKESDYTAAIQSHVHRWFSSKGCSLPALSIEDRSLTVPRRRSTDARRLAWIQTQVRGSIQLLCAKGMVDEVIEALNLPQNLLDQLVQVNERKQNK